MRFVAILLLIGFFSTACGNAPVLRDDSTSLQTVREVDVDRYLGLWYEIARFPNRFEEHCEAPTAEYALRDDGRISVTNTCRLHSPDGDLKVANGRARIVDEETNAKLKVSFFGPFWGDYWIIGLADDYSLAMVGEPRGRYLWILAREPFISDVTREEAMRHLEGLGYQIDALYFPQHARTD